MKTPMRKVCANCGENYINGDKYCRYCGAPMGKPAYIEEDFACIYGPPPVKRTHTCAKCVAAGGSRPAPGPSADESPSPLAVF